MTNIDGTTITYKYNVDGIRTSKTVNGVTTTFTTIDGRITSQMDGTNFLYFWYNSDDELFGFEINDTNYIYVKNIQGDIIAITDTNGTIVVRYTYDAWGNVTSITGSLASTIGELNPMRYRSYYLDAETGYYYLQSRYYEPEMCRFINSDKPTVIALGSSFGTNMYAYCNNNPITNVDPSGYLSYPGQIHRLVLEDIVARFPFLSMKNTYIYYNGKNVKGGFGYCDVYNPKTGEVWELKRETCSYAKAKAQLNKYTAKNSKLKAKLNLPLKAGGGTITEDSFIVTIGLQRHYVWYWNEGGGIIYYNYSKVTDWKRVGNVVVATVVIAGVVVFITATGGAGAVVVLA